MSDSRIVDEFSISQSQRFYCWRPKWGHNPPITNPEVISHSANMLMIPASDEVMRTLFEVRVGELISLSGCKWIGGTVGSGAVRSAGPIPEPELATWCGWIARSANRSRSEPRLPCCGFRRHLVGGFRACRRSRLERIAEAPYRVNHRGCGRILFHLLPQP